MPGFDGTGPLGQGSRTGDGFGSCDPTAGPYYGQPVKCRWLNSLTELPLGGGGSGRGRR